MRACFRVLLTAVMEITKEHYLFCNHWRSRKTLSWRSTPHLVSRIAVGIEQ